MTDIVFVVPSKFSRQIRLTQTIWRKIETQHPEFSGRSDYLGEIRNAVEDPDYVVRGWGEARLGLRWREIAPARPKHLCVVYRELDGDGFVVTAFFVSRYERLLRREVLWQRS
jgi:hypothetical protein